MKNALLKTDRRHRYDEVVLPPRGELTTERPPTIAERKAKWYARILKAPDYPMFTGDRREQAAREYELQEMLDGREPDLF